MRDKQERVMVMLQRVCVDFCVEQLMSNYKVRSHDQPRISCEISSSYHRSKRLYRF